MAAERWHVRVDRGLCVGSGMCAGSAPGAFALDAGHRSRPLAEETDPSEEVLAAAETCPVEAITISRPDTGETVFPPDE
ncbi:ferredoxin [Streptosporangium nondiastaticum]|uniref:Ferredoxin n=2 Tax=Actinomycetes TaxID=1760 RepID=A0A9X7JI02_9ACTN|nr:MULTISPECIES: ferredoxin [Actinomycetes]PSJ24078.1 ferredoxin [Streptosporangium nondiastaticum]WKU44636.1 ferredoxin [Streptomyces sp. VNUA116]